MIKKKVRASLNREPTRFMISWIITYNQISLLYLMGWTMTQPNSYTPILNRPWPPI